MAMICGFDGSSVTASATGWTSLHNTGTLNILTREVDGTEGATVSVSSGAANEQGAFVVLEISGCDEADIEASTGATAASAAPNSDSYTHTGGSADMLVISCFGASRGDRSISAYPYADTNLDVRSAGGGPGGGVGVCTDELTGATFDPGAFTLSGSAPHGGRQLS